MTKSEQTIAKLEAEVEQLRIENAKLIEIVANQARVMIPQPIQIPMPPLPLNPWPNGITWTC